jgi:hypothetical protein
MRDGADPQVVDDALPPFLRGHFAAPQVKGYEVVFWTGEDLVREAPEALADAASDCE